MKLSKQALQVLEELKSGSPMTVEELESEGFDQAMVNRAALELQEQGLIDVEEDEEVVQGLTDEGRDVMERGSPEHILLEQLEDGPARIEDIEGTDTDVAVGKAREKGWIEIEDGQLELTEEGKEARDTDTVKQRLETGDFDSELEERGLVKTETRTVKLLKLAGEGEDVEPGEIEEEFNVEARTRTPRTGRKHFYKQIIDHADKVWRELGFQEMSGDFVVPGFLNFDALYIPQDHPAREMQDTFFMEEPYSSDISGYGEKVENVRETHENGGSTGSDGWGYDWSQEEAERNVLRTHTTAVSARKLSELKEEDLPKKYYTTSRVFRNETVDRFHNAEFYQSDGIVVGKELTFAHLKGYLSEFFEKMGYDEFRLIPTYYPYTEMSVEVQVFDPREEEWIGLGGAGMFRPEVVEPMLGFEATVLAWGLGIPRIAMKAAELDDVRELYRNEIEILENTEVWRPESR